MTEPLSTRTTRPVFLLRPENLPEGLRAVTRYRELASGETLYHRGDAATCIFAVQRGRLALFSYTTEGKPVPLYLARPGECVSEAALFAENYCGDVVAEIPSRVAIFPKSVLLTAFNEHPALAAEFMTLLTRRFNMLRIRLELRNLQSARERILQYLRVTAPPGTTDVIIDRPLKSIADDLGLTHESFYRTLAHLVREGVVTRKKGCIAFQTPGASCADQKSRRSDPAGMDGQLAAL